jgi:FG-GAP repeat
VTWCALLMLGSLAFLTFCVPADAQLAPALRPSFTLTATPSPESGFGSAVALSSDGDTALVGEGEGPAWVFVRSGSGWTEQARLTRPAGSGGEGFGCSVALSANGNTAVVGAPGRSASPGSTAIPGAALVFTREGQAWREQAKLTPDDATNPGKESCDDFPSANGFYGSGFGFSVAVSGEGNTVLVGDGADNHNRGAAWVFTRSGSDWTQQGPKLIPNGEHGEGRFGTGIALSSDGSTALVSAPWSATSACGGVYGGQAWVFTREAATWQQDQELAPRPHTCGEKLGSGVALSGDGSTVLLGAEGNNGAWVFGRSGSIWSPQTPRLTLEPDSPALERGHAGQFGARVAMASDGNTALVSGLPQYDCGKYMSDPCGFPGAAWALTRTGTAWVRRGAKLTGADAFGSGLALSAEGSTALIGAPIEDSDSRDGFALVSTVVPPAPNAFYQSVLAIDTKGVIRQQLVSSSAGTFTAVATVSARSLRHLPKLSCHKPNSKHSRRCLRERLALYGGATARTAGPGVGSLVIRPNRAVRVALAKRRSLELIVHITISFTPNAGPTPASQTFSATVGAGRSSERY